MSRAFCTAAQRFVRPVGSISIWSVILLPTTQALRLTCSFPRKCQRSAETGALTPVFYHDVARVSSAFADSVQIIDRGVVEVKES